MTLTFYSYTLPVKVVFRRYDSKSMLSPQGEIVVIYGYICKILELLKNFIAKLSLESKYFGRLVVIGETNFVDWWLLEKLFLQVGGYSRNYFCKLVVIQETIFADCWLLNSRIKYVK